MGGYQQPREHMGTGAAPEGLQRCVFIFLIAFLVLHFLNCRIVADAALGYRIARLFFKVDICNVGMLWSRLLRNNLLSSIQPRLSSTLTKERKKSKPLRPKNARRTFSPGSWLRPARVMLQLSCLPAQHGLWQRQQNTRHLHHLLPEADRTSPLSGVISTVDQEIRRSGFGTTRRHRRRRGLFACCATKLFQQQVQRISGLIYKRSTLIWFLKSFVLMRVWKWVRLLLSQPWRKIMVL